MTREEKVSYISQHWRLPDEERLLVMEDVAPKTYGAIHIPEASQLPPTSGVVARIGNLVKKVAVGDKVIFARFAGTVLAFAKDVSKEADDDLRVRVLAESEVLVIVDAEFIEDGYKLREAVV